MNFNISPIAFYPSRAAQQWRNAYNQCNIAVVTGDNLPPFIINNAPDTAPDTVEIYDPNTDTLIHTIHDVTDILMHTSTVNGVSVKSWIYQGTSAGIWGFSNPGYYYLKIGNYYSDIIKFGAVGGDYVKLEYQFFDDIITADGTLISKYIVYRQIFETVLWHPNYEVNEEGKENNGVFYALQQITKKTCGFSDTVNEAQLDTLNLARMADNVNIEARTNGFSRTFATNTFEIKSKWESDDVASIEVTFDLFNIMMKYQQSNVAPEPLPLPTPPVPPANYFIKGKTQSGVSSVKMNINGVVQTIPVANGEFSFGYDTPITSLRTSVDSGNLNPDTPLQNCDKITELDLSESDGFETATSVILNSLANCTTINFGTCTFAAVTTIKKMFDSDKKLTAVNMPSATFASVTQGSLMFADCDVLSAVSMPNATLKTGAYGMFTGCANLSSIDLRNCTFEDETSTGVMFCDCKKIGQSTFRFDAATFASVTDCARMFDGATIANSITAFATMFPVWAAQPTNAQSMFKGTKVGTFSLATLDTSICTNMQEFLSGVSGYFIISSIDMSAATNLKECFADTAFDVMWHSWLNTQTFAAAENVSYMFKNSLNNSTEPAIFGAATFANVTDATGMFYGCAEQKVINLSSATFASLTNASNMFYGCAMLETLNLSAATFANVTNANGIFYNCAKLQSVSVPATSTMTVSFGLAQSSELAIQSFEMFASWVADMSGQTSPTATFNSNARQTWQSQSYVQYTAARLRFTSRNWTLQL